MLTPLSGYAELVCEAGVTGEELRRGRPAASSGEAQHADDDAGRTKEEKVLL